MIAITYQQKKPRRIRMLLCPVCGEHIQAERKKSHDDLAITVCTSCYFCISNEAAQSWLEYPSGAQGDE